MSDATPHTEPPYHLILDPEEVPLLASALRLLISDEAHEPDIRRLAREVLAALDDLAPPTVPSGRHPMTVTLTPQQMKITYSAAKLLLNDLQRDQPTERDLLHSILAKLPDEHTMRAIEIE